MKKKIMLGVVSAATLVSVAFAAGTAKLPKAKAEGHFTIISHVCKASSPDLKENFADLELCLQLIKNGRTTLVREAHFANSLSTWNTFLQSLNTADATTGATKISEYDPADQARITQVTTNVTTAYQGAQNPASFQASSLQ